MLRNRSSALIALIALTALVAFAMRTAAASQGPDRPLTVATDNVHHGLGSDGGLELARVADVIAAAEAEVVGWHEVGRRWSAAPTVHTRPKGSECCSGCTSSTVPSRIPTPTSGGAPRRQVRTAIVSRYPRLLWSKTPLPKLGGAQQGLLEALVNVRGVRVRALGSNLQHDSSAECAA